LIQGLKPSTGRPKVFRGFGGQIKAYLRRINFNTCPLRFRARAVFPSLEIPNVVGRLDIMKGAGIILEDERGVRTKS